MRLESVSKNGLAIEVTGGIYAGLPVWEGAKFQNQV